MLVLMRRPQETVMIGHEISFTVLGVRGNQVRIGVKAPKTVAVHREEVYERIQQENVSRLGKGSASSMPPSRTAGGERPHLPRGVAYPAGPR